MKQISEQLRKLHDHNNSISLFVLGYLYEKGELLPQDLNRAYNFYIKSASVDNSINDVITKSYRIAANYNAMILQYKLGAKNEEINFNWIDQVEAHGWPEVLYNIGYLYELGVLQPQDYKKAFNLYNLASQRGYTEATFRLGLLYENGFGCNQNSQEAKNLFRRAHQQGNKKAKFALNKDWKSIWPEEDLSLLSKSKYRGRIYGQSSLSNQLPQLLNIYAIAIASNGQYLIDNKECRTEENNIIVWLEMSSIYGLENGFYSMGKHALETLKEFFKNNASTYLSSWMLMIPFYTNNSQSVETYVMLYAWSQVWLHRAQRLGINIDIELKELNEHKELVEKTFSTIYIEYREYMHKYDAVWEKAKELVALNRKAKENILSFPTVTSMISITSQLEKFILNSNVREYSIWSLCLLDGAKTDDYNNRFFTQTIKTSKFMEFIDFINTNELDINCVIPDVSISPLEMMVKQRAYQPLKSLLERADVDVNFRAPIFEAIKNGDITSVELLLSREDLDINLKCKINEILMSPVEAAKLYMQLEILQLINNYVNKKNRDSNKLPANKLEDVEALYFQYKKDDMSINATKSDSQKNVVRP